MFHVQPCTATPPPPVLLKINKLHTQTTSVPDENKIFPNNTSISPPLCRWRGNRGGFEPTPHILLRQQCLRKTRQAVFWKTRNMPAGGQQPSPRNKGKRNRSSTRNSGPCASPCFSHAHTRPTLIQKTYHPGSYHIRRQQQMKREICTPTEKLPLNVSVFGGHAISKKKNTQAGTLCPRHTGTAVYSVPTLPQPPPQQGLRQNARH